MEYADWTLAELKKAVTRLKADEPADDVGLVAELLHHSPDIMLEALLHLFRTALLTGRVPETWKQTVFNMLPKQGKQNQHPIFVQLHWSSYYTKHLRIWCWVG